MSERSLFLSANSEKERDEWVFILSKLLREKVAEPANLYAFLFFSLFVCPG